MRKFKVRKSENEIMELFIAYGLCRILKDNDIPWVLTNKPSYYLIETPEHFEYRELILSSLEEADLWNVNSSLNKAEQLKRLEALNQYFNSEENMERVFRYYETWDEKYLKGTKKRRSHLLWNCLLYEGDTGQLDCQ
ncbi:hypothetical protein [Anoxybacteroides tepidamans]|uniref:hypothetical protein n=1 Tax=Anoxybacteroides tepidamans TaxID=265948 RepID=UPI00048640DF|nr:hypothetical protein [Anoxybacillus tepidamans]